MHRQQTDSFRCAHYLSKYLPLTENWIYRILINHQQYKPVVLTRKKVNLNLFSISFLYSLDDFSKMRQYVEILFFRLFDYFRFFERICKKNSIQILHVHFGYHGVKLLGLKKKLNIPMICSFYGDDAFAYPRLGNNIKRYHRLFRQADKILVLGIYMKAELIRLGCPENKISIHHLGIDVDNIRFSKRSIPKGGRVRFLIASSFVKKKGVDLAVKALANCKEDYDFTLDIIGDGPLKDEIIQAIEMSGIKSRITLHGYKTYDYFINLAYECDIFIQASLTTAQNNKEGTPMAIVDALATGMAVVSTRHSDIPEIVVDGENGYLANENDVGSLEHCIRKLLDDPDKIEVFSMQGRAWIEKEFNARTQTIKLEEYYSKLIDGAYTDNK